MASPAGSPTATPRGEEVDVSGQEQPRSEAGAPQESAPPESAPQTTWEEMFGEGMSEGTGWDGGEGASDMASWGLTPTEVSSDFLDADLPLLDQIRVRQKTRRNARQRETEMMVQLERTYRSRIGQLEQQLETMGAEKRRARQEWELKMREKQREIDGLHAMVAREVADLQRRQEAVEAAGPAFHVQIQAAREQLRDPFLSDAAYHELLKIPESERLLPDAVRIVVHEALADLRRENERLRRASAADRDGCVRAEEEAARAERARVAAERKAAQEVADVTDEMRALEARLERVESELREAVLRGEVLAAKGSMYDEAKSELEELQRKHDGLLTEVASLRRMKEEYEQLRVDHRDAVHRTELLSQGGAHLEAQVAMLQRHVRKLEEDVDARDKQVAELKAARDRLEGKVLEGATDSRAEYEVRLQGEIARIREEGAREVERVRREMEHGYDRELSVVRELRDAAQEEAREARERLEQVRRQLEEVGEKSSARAKEADVREAQLLGRIEVLALERDQLRAAVDERGSRVAMLQAEADGSADQARLLRDRLHAAEHEAARKIADLEARMEAAQEKIQHYELLESNLDEAILVAGRAPGGGDGGEGEGGVVGAVAVVKALEGAVPTAVKRRVKQALVLAGRCNELETTVARLKAQLGEEKERSLFLEGELQAARSRLGRVNQPQSFILEELDKLESRAVRAERRCKQLMDDLSKSEGEKKALIRDMKDLISDREAVEALRNAVSASQAASVAPPRRPAGPRRSSGLSSGLYAVPEEPGQRGGSARSEAGASTGAVRRGPLGRAASMAVRGGRMSGGSMMGGGSAAGGGGAGASRLGQSEARRAMLGRSATLATIRVS